MARELWETIVDLAEAMMPGDEQAAVLRITAMEFDLPLEVQVVATRAGAAVSAGLPRYRATPGFRQQPGRMRLSLNRREADAGA